MLVQRGNGEGASLISVAECSSQFTLLKTTMIDLSFHLDTLNSNGCIITV